jgi:hypothetical protein
LTSITRAPRKVLLARIGRLAAVFTLVGGGSLAAVQPAFAHSWGTISVECAAQRIDIGYKNFSPAGNIVVTDTFGHSATVQYTIGTGTVHVPLGSFQSPITVSKEGTTTDPAPEAKEFACPTLSVAVDCVGKQLTITYANLPPDGKFVITDSAGHSANVAYKGTTGTAQAALGEFKSPITVTQQTGSDPTSVRKEFTCPSSPPSGGSGTGTPTDSPSGEVLGATAPGLPRTGEAPGS